MNVTSPEMESDKTRTGEVAALLVASPMSAESISAAALARSIDMGATLLLDEMDTIFKRSRAASESVELLRGVLDSGWRRTGQYVRMVGQGASMEVRRFSTFGPKMLIGIGDIPGTLGSRPIRIQLRRRRPDTEPIERFRIRKVTPEGYALRDQLAAWASGTIEELRTADPELPEELRDRIWDSWEPLMAIANLAEGGWPTRAWKAAVPLSADGAAEEESANVQ